MMTSKCLNQMLLAAFATPATWGLASLGRVPISGPSKTIESGSWRPIPAMPKP